MRAAGLSVLVSMQVGCCRQSFSYPVIVDVGRIEVTVGEKSPVARLEDEIRIDDLVRFIDSRRSRWCSPRFGSLPDPDAKLVLHIKGGQNGVGFGKEFLVAEFSGGKYRMELSGEEQQEFLRLLGVDEKQVFEK